MANNFFIEIEMDGETQTISLYTDRVQIYIYQKCDGQQERILEIECSDCDNGDVRTEVDRVHEDDLGFDQHNSENGMTITSRK